MSRKNDELFDKILDERIDSEGALAEEKMMLRLREDLAALREQVPVCTLTFDGIRNAIERQSAPRKRFAWGWALTPLAAATLGFMLLRNPEVVPSVGEDRIETPIARSTPQPKATPDIAANVTNEDLQPDLTKVAPTKRTFATVPATRTRQAPSRRGPQRASSHRPSTKISAPNRDAADTADGMIPDMIASMPEASVDVRGVGVVDPAPAVIISREQDAQGTSVASEVEAKSDVVVDG